MSKGEQDKIYKKIKTKTETAIENSGNTVGVYIYENLLKSPFQKIRGKLIRTIDRKFYREELKKILQKQKEFHSELRSENLYNDCVRELYKNNKDHIFLLSKRDFVHLFSDDIIFYQRPLKSQKSSISNCSFEFKKYSVDNEERIEYLKAIPKSHPLYQEFRLWQWIYNLRIYSRNDDCDVTINYLNDNERYADLFEFLSKRKEIEQKALLKYFKLKDSTHRWNFVENKKYPCYETRSLISTRLEKVENVPMNFLNDKTEQYLWHIIYSVKDKNEYEKALITFAKKNRLDIESFVENFKKFPTFKNEYGSYSAKALKKLIPLMRIGRYWNLDKIDEQTKSRIDKIVTGEFDEEIKNKVREKSISLTNNNHFQGLQLWLASYIVYDRHSEAATINKWETIQQLGEYIDNFKQHSLRNPIVEQIIIETLRVVKDIWHHFGKDKNNFFEEIHIELGREMKNNADERKRITNQMIDNENTNIRIKSLLSELKNDSSIQNVRPNSAVQQELLKIYEEGVLNSDIEIPEDIFKISKTAQPSNPDLQRYKLWLEQKYRSPYTGQIIPLSRLFTTEYEIEHIIPQSRYFDDSFNNKVICESSVNKLKDNQMGLEFIKNHHGEIVQTGFENSVKIFEESEYQDFVKTHYIKNRSKRNKLLMEEIPEKMIERQINDTRYIAKFISTLLSNLVRSASNDDGVNSKNLIQVNGKITSLLKQDWGINDVWNDLILPRFYRMNKITNSDSFTRYSEKYQKYLPTVPIEFSKNYQAKRIDHRHHALDALIIACATRDHVNLLNNKYAKSKERFDLNRKLRKFERTAYNHPQSGERIEREVPKEFLKPWNNFTVDLKNFLEKIVVSFKQNIRVINKTSNIYKKWVEVNKGKVKKEVKQSGVNWAIRKPLHKKTFAGKVELGKVKVPNGKILTATRKNLDASFDLKTIDSITDTGIQKILKNYLLSKGSNSSIAFAPEGIEEMNKNIKLYNDGKPHKPIYKVRIFELGSKFILGLTGNKKLKYVEAAKGTNLFFAVYQNEDEKRNFETIPLNIVIERQKQGLSSVPENNKKGHKLLFYLSPNDLVYVPDEDERENNSIIDFYNLTTKQINNIYKTVSFSGSQCFFIKHDVANSIVDKSEYSKSNKMEKSIDGIMIKEHCIKLKVDRLGNILKTYR